MANVDHAAIAKSTTHIHTHKKSYIGSRAFVKEEKKECLL